MWVLPAYSVAAMIPFTLDVMRPWGLLGLALLVPTIYLAWTSKTASSRSREIAGTALRAVAVVALVGAVSGARMVRKSDRLCVTFLVDQSKSIDPDTRAAALAEARTSLRGMAPEHRVAVIGFAGASVLQQLPSTAGDIPVSRGQFRRDFTDIGRAIRLAISVAPQDAANRIVLLSDGNDTADASAIAAAATARQANTPIDTFTLGAAVKGDIRVERLILDPQIDANQPLAIKAVVHSDVARTARLTLRRRGRPVNLTGSDDRDYITIALKPGANLVPVIEERIADGGFYDYEVNVEPVGGDATAGNNRAIGVTRVMGSPGVLIVDGSDNGRQGANLQAALRKAKIRAVLVNETGFPDSAMAFSHYDCLVLSDVPASSLDVAQMKLAQRWIQAGGGFVWVGGVNSFGPGAYSGTPLEEAAPVSCDVKRHIERASLALAIAIDQSGSMGMTVGGSETKMDLANNAAAEAIGTLDHRDFAGVVMVDTQYKWITQPSLQRMTHSGGRNLRQKVLANKPGGGGIYCNTALKASLNALAETSAMSKHVLLFADAADSEQQRGCEQMVRKANASHGVTVSCVGLGDRSDKDARFLERLAATGKGRFYITDDARKLPQFFIRDVSMASRNAFIEPEGGIQPAIVTLPGAGAAGVDAILTGVRSTPKLRGQVATTLKGRATLLMHGPETDDALLAKWQYGLGRAVAWTSDAQGKWAGDWVGWEGFGKFWSQVVRWATRNQNLDSPVTAWAAVRGRQGVIAADAIDDDGEPLTNLTLRAVVDSANPDTPTQTVELHQTAPGRYEGRFQPRDVGAYIVSIVNDEGKGLDATAAVMSYSPEFARLDPNRGAMARIARASGGRALASLTDLFVRPAGPVYTYHPIVGLLLAAATFLFFADIVVRRFVLPEMLIRWLTPARPRQTDGTTVDRLRRVKAAIAKPVAVARQPRAEGATSVVTPEIVESTEPAPAEKPAETPPKAPPAAAGGSLADRLRAAKRRARQEMEDKSQRDR